MKQAVILLACCLLCGIALSQSATEFTHEIVSTKPSVPPAKDFWIAIPQIYNTGDSGKYAEIYIASQAATTIHIRGGKFAPVDKKIKPLEQFIFKVETQDFTKSMEMTTSGVVENKGIHIWSDGGDLSVYLYTRNAISGGGTMVLPTSNWGNEYVVAAYEANEKYGDKPGEFTIVAAENATQITITSPEPLARTGSAQSFPANTPFSLTINQGEAIQFITTPYSDYLDITGAVISSSKPVGVFSAVQCATIYYGTSGCDFVCEMMPPVCSWGKKYMIADHDASGEGTWYSVIASQDNQEIYGYVDLMLNKYEPYFIRRYGSMVFQSDAPFLLTMYPAISPLTLFGYGHPSMVCVSSVESYSREALFQMPSDTSRKSVDIVYPKGARSSTKIDGVGIDSIPGGAVTFGKVQGYDMSSIRSISKGVHRISSDSAFTFLAQGWTMQTSFAWGASLSPLCLGHEDTLPPVASIFGDCNMTKLTFTDSQANASKIIGYVVDSLLNLRLDFDPLFIPGNLQTSFFYELRLNDASKSGRARIRVIDRFGNVTTVTSSIAARPNPKTVPTSIEIPFAAASIPNFREVELANTTITPLVLTGPTGLRFANGTQGFALVSPDMSDLARDSVRTFLVSYVAPDAQLRRDTIVYGGECTFVRIPLESKDVGPITGTTGVDFGCLTVGTSREDVVLVHNNGLYELTVTSMTFDDAAHFTVISPPLPFILAPGKRLAVTVRYSPDAVDTNCTTAHIATKEVGELTAQVCGCGLPQSSVRIEASSTKKELLNALKSREFAWLAPVPSPADRGESVRFIFGLAHSAQVSLDLFDVEGRQVHSITPAGFPSGTHEMLLDTRNLATGSYVYKYTANGVEYTGKVTIR